MNIILLFRLIFRVSPFKFKIGFINYSRVTFVKYYLNENILPLREEIIYSYSAVFSWICACLYSILRNVRYVIHITTKLTKLGPIKNINTGKMVNK